MLEFKVLELPCECVLHRYWNFPVNVYSAPELSYLNQQTPTLTRYESSASLIWQLVGPGAPVSPTFFVGRFTFYLAVPQQGNYTFFISADDSASLYVNGLLVVGSQGSYTTTLPAGPSQFIIIYQQFGGWAQISFQWNAGVAGSQAQALPWGQVTPFLPGTPVPVTVTVNGVPSVPACATQLLDASTGGGLGLPLNSEPASATLPNGYCGYLYSSYRTPTLSASASSAVVYSPSSLTVMGSFLAGVSTSSYTAQVGGLTATVMSIATSNSSTVPQLQNLTLGLPLLPAGTWPVQVVASGFGAVRGPLGLSTPLISINYGLSINTGLSFIPNSGKASFWGGVTLTITGSGFVPSNASLNNGMAMNVSYISGGPGQNYLATVLSSTTSVLSLYISPWYNASLTPTSGNVYFRISVWNQATPSTAVTTTFQFPIDPSYTPTVLSVSPSSITPTTTGASITLQWQIKSSPLPSAASSGSSSVVTVTFLGGSGSTYACTSPTVTASVVGSSSTIGYNETLTCTLPTYLPAASYTVVVTHPSYGVGYLPAALTVALSVTSISPSQGSLGGGLEVVLSGTGFSILNGTTSNTIMFGGVVCDVISVNVSQLTCITRAYPNASTITQPVASTLSASALPGVFPTSFSAITFTYSPSLTDTITAINTTRGSTAGGTPLLITGTFQGNQSNYQVLLGGPNSGASCNISFFNNTSITCITSAPPTANPANPFLICVLNPATGCAYSATSLSYQYVNLWSRRSTWGGGTPPSDGDTVFIPSGSTVVLDISPPRLYLLVIQGNLMFDPQANTSIWLQCNYILVMGGNFSAGTPSTPYAGPNAKITLWGPPGATELPIYGSKVVGVRQGWFILHGQHKTPVWTQLNATANTDDTSITVNGIVNWVPGDRIAISSSSVYATDVDEAIIVSVTNNTVTNTSTLVLDKPLNFTHLGVVMTNFPNDSRNHVLDMRAEVLQYCSL
ncbi:hypothetical protein CEUSTIGMA_g8556.t1 [Chlamydomonas eustigma]|uniref:PA14 domain-containing protein n=1 Tax=Chlamydomonas eustigma TaxID=1157962 RepID=A0A250XDZ4_9CHLO|nr:hypothetical protein CEUSTIGMA_g8556.t1 [Chlamydomonas eustigma]|eukprot:GAX81122.1 hypothetical protein CEUSTIGMA_g8556.t1 [Chlamydomonas eustigma]